MTIKEFKDKLAEEIRNKLRKNNTPTPILDRLELHIKDFEGVSVQDIIGSKNMRHDVYVSFIYQICYPSRIKMDIDENYQPITKKRIAITNCKSNKQDYTCSADEMYTPSPLYRVQREFFIKGYDDWYIVSSKYGIIHHTQIISPYNNSIAVSSQGMAEKHQVKGWDSNVVDQVDKQIKWMVDKGWDVDYHTSRAYFKPLSKEVKSSINYIKQPAGIGGNISKYEALTPMLDTHTLKECCDSLSKRDPNKQKETDKWFYHRDHEPFFGTSMKIINFFKKKGIKLNVWDMHQLSWGKRKQAKGWVTDETFLPQVYQTDSGQWRIKKSK